MLKKFQSRFLKNSKESLVKWGLILIGSLSWCLTMVKSGLPYSFGIGFWGANGHDAVWHLALIESFSRGNFNMPVFAGSILQNYHIGFDLVLALVHRITSIPVSLLYFQVVPVVLSLLIGVLTYEFTFNWIKSKSASLWATFFVYFGGSFGYLIGKGESAFWSTQAISTLINPPFAFSLVVILLGLILVQKGKYVWAGVILGTLIEVKAYAGALVLGGLLVACFRNRKLVKTFLVSLAISLTLFFFFEKSATSLLVWQPFWFLETMMGLTDRVGWLKFGEAMLNYKLGHVYFKLIPAYLVAFAVFWIGNMGTRIVKETLLFKWLRNFKKIGYLEVFTSAVIVAGGVIPMLFLQKGTPWNTIQFFYYSLFFSGILAGIAVSELKFSRKWIWGIVMVLLTLSSTIFTLKNVYIPGRPPAELPKDEVEALNFLKTLPDGVVLTYPYDSVKAKEAEANPPRPLYLYESTAYVSAFSAHEVYLEDQVNLDITGYDWKNRLSGEEDWYKETDQDRARRFLKDNNIKYVYWVKPQRAVLGDSQLGINQIFENNSVYIYQVELPNN